MARYLGKGRIGYCQRTGFKVKYDDLVEDGERPGLLVEKGWEDEVHPQRFIPVIGDDVGDKSRPAPAMDNINASIHIGFLGDPLTGETFPLPRARANVRSVSAIPETAILITPQQVQSIVRDVAVLGGHSFVEFPSSPYSAGTYSSSVYSGRPFPPVQAIVRDVTTSVS